MSIVVVVPLANDVNEDWSGIGPNFKLRAEQAQAMVETFQLKRDTVYVAQAAGTLAGYEGKNTLAELGYAYLKTLINPDGWIVNRDEKHVWGTLPEMEYVVRHAPADCDFVWVSQARHMPRIRLIAKYFLSGDVYARSRFEVSDQTKEIPLLREWLSYLLLLGKKFGLGQPIAWARRRCHMDYDRA